MNSRTLTRGTPGRRPVQATRTPPKPQKPSTVDRALRTLPISEQALNRIATWSIMSAVAVAGLAAATWAGLPQAGAVAVAEEIGHAGFRVEGIEITGAKRMDAMTVYAVALDQRSRAMPLVDLGGVREKLLTYGWIADAQVSRRLPDKLVINIIERTPAAVWQNKGQLTLIDSDGVLLEPVSVEAMPDLPLVIGEGANTQAPAYRRLLDAAPSLRARVRAATWVGNRRWNLMFQSGETLVLPEDDAPGALARFAALDGSRSLLGKGWVRFDMRDPTKLVVRRPEDSGAAAVSETQGDATPPAPQEAAPARIYQTSTDRQG